MTHNRPERPTGLPPTGPRAPGGIVHSYLGYDPKRFPSPTEPAGDALTDAAMDHLMTYGSYRPLTDEELAEAVEIDPSQIAGLGPSLDALIAMLEERKRRILETYEPRTALATAHRDFAAAATEVEPPSAKLRDQIDRAVRSESIPELERLWYRAERERGPLAGQVMRLIDAMGTRLEIERLLSRYDFTGRQPVTPPEALAIAEELETIDRLLEQLREAKKNAKIGIVDMDALRRFVDEADVEQLRGMEERIREMVREQADLAGLERTADGYRLGAKALRTIQGKLLDEIFSELDASRSGRHAGPIVGEGAVELPRTRGYEFGDSAAHLNIAQTLTNAAARSAGAGRGFAVGADDIEVHETRNNPKAATAVIMDMSGSMRHGGQYIACKKMALALDGLIRREYPGDHLSLIEMYSFAKLRHVSELPELMPKPVTIHDPWVRLRVDMSDPEVSELMVHPHFTNIQASLRLARQMLAAQDTPNRQIMLITDGLPTAHYEGEHLYLLYPPDPLTEQATMREAQRCAKEGITINIFLVPSWSQNSEDIAFAHRLAETTRGRVFFTAGADLDRFVLWDYLQQKRRVIG
ncbi:MAG: VWA domain-containing protein [Planctomycetota bacterium]|nr:MAG: VWA domain-containing protein [Planctomycetota bacterium]